MTLIVATESERLQSTIPIVIGVGFILAIAASRLMLHIHSMREVVAGLVIGTAALVLFGAKATCATDR